MTGARTRSTFDLVDSRRSIASWRIDGAGMGRLPAQRARPSGAPTRLAKLQSRLEGIVTLATFTCQPREAVIGRRQENQWLGELQRGTGPLQNPLFLANVTMPS